MVKGGGCHANWLQNATFSPGQPTGAGPTGNTQALLTLNR